MRSDVESCERFFIFITVLPNRLVRMTTPLEGDPGELLGILDDTARTLRHKGKLSEAVNVLWQALHLRVQVRGRDAAEVAEAARDIIKFLNKLAVAAIKDGDYDACVAYLGKALKISEPDAIPGLEEFRILTLNNASCCHRRLGNTQQALRCAKDALDVGFQTHDDKSLACSHLNACSVLSQAGRHEEALRHARDAVNSSLQALRSTQEDPAFEAAADEDRERAKQEQLATLCIAYHNAGVEFEHLGRKECLQLYRRALDLAETHLPKKRKMSAKFRKSLQSAQMMMQRIYGSSERGDGGRGGETDARSEGGGGRRRPKSARAALRSNSSGNGSSSLPNLHSGSGPSTSGSPAMPISDQLREAREKVRELEQEMQAVGRSDADQGVGGGRLEGEDRGAVRLELDELHERTKQALASVKEIQRQNKDKRGTMENSASAPVLAASMGSRADSVESLQIESAGMIVMGPGLMSGVGPTINGKGNTAGGDPLKNKRRRRRPMSAPRSGKSRKKKLPPWARSKAPDYENMPEPNLMAVRLFYQLHLVLEKRRSRAIDIFREFDDDDSGSINKREFSSGCRALGIRVTKAQRRSVFDMIDDDKVSVRLYCFVLSRLLPPPQPPAPPIPFRGLVPHIHVYTPASPPALTIPSQPVR